MQNIFHTNTNVLCLIGHPIKHTYSPFIHNLSANLLGLEFLYLPFDIPQDNLKDALRGMVALGIKGFNVTIPYKETILPYLHTISEEAAIVGSVNTVVNDLGKLVGYNTDVNGIYETLVPYKDEISGLEVSVFGAGGAARALIYNLIRYFRPSKINIINRTEQRAESLKLYFLEKMKFENIECYELFPPDILPILNQSKLIVNTTSLGMHPDVDDSPISLPNAFIENQIVFDMVYNPVSTKFLRQAKAEGATIINGIKMLVYQGAKSFELWTGTQMPVDSVYDALIKYLEP